MQPQLDAEATLVFREGLLALAADETPVVVAGAFALNHYTGIWRDTKDLDLFVEPAHAARTLDILAGAGFNTHVEEKHWLGKAFKGEILIDVIWGSGNWMHPVDEHWFRYAEPGTLVGVPVLFAPAEDIILSKAYVAGRERYDGADIAHLIRARGAQMDWRGLVDRFGPHWQLLLQYLILFRFAYPEERDIVPAALVHELAARVGTIDEEQDGLDFRGPLVDRYAYLHDIRYDGRSDPREEIARREGLPIADVVRRRQLDSEALDEGLPYRVADHVE